MKINKDYYTNMKEVKRMFGTKVAKQIEKKLRGCTVIKDEKGTTWIPKRDIAFAHKLATGQEVSIAEWD